VPSPAPDEKSRVEPAPARAAPPPAAVVRATTPGPKYNDLMTAVLYRDAAAVSELIAFGRWPDKPDSQGVTPLMVAAMLGDTTNAEALLKAGANPDAAMPIARERRDSAMTALLERYATSKRP
jgi:ankyrin repeat protein